MKFFVFVFFTIFIFLSCVKCAKILGLFHTPTYSHYILGMKLLKPLAERGHHITMVSPYKIQNPPKNWKDIILTNLDKVIEQERKSFLDNVRSSNYERTLMYNYIGYELEVRFLEHPAVKALLHSNETYDLIILEKFYNEAMLGFSYHFNAPYILLSTLGYSRWINSITGNPGSPSYLPDIYLEYSSNMNFWKRLHNTFFYFYAEAIRQYLMFPKNKELLTKYFPNAPKFEDLYHNASLVFVNTHSSVKAAFPSVPNMIEIGGFHVEPPNKLPQDLQKFLDESKEGVIYFSLGSVIKTDDMLEETRNAILKTLSTVKQKVLWKCENESLPNQPSNVKLGKWFPQQDILAHPNVVLFITHGGLLSSFEAIYHGVPLLVMPVFAEQLMNGADVENYGYGVNIPFKEFTQEKFKLALHQVLDDPRYAQNMKQRSKLFHDQETKPLERAIFWIEYVLRHKGAPHLKSVTLNLKWYQYLLLDVIAFILIVLLTVIVSTIFCIKRIFNTKTKNVRKSKKNN